MGTKCSVSYHWQVRLWMPGRLPASMVLIRIFLFALEVVSSSTLPQCCPSDGGSVAGNIGCEVFHFTVSNICNATIIFLEVCWSFRSTTSSLTQAPGSTSVLAGTVSQMLSLLWHYADKFLYCLSLSIQCR